MKPGAQITVTGNSQITLLKYVPTARKDVAVTPLTLARGEKTEPEAATLVGLTTPERREQFWLRRNDAQLGVRSVGISGDPVVVMFGYEGAPLGFSVTLEDIQPDTKPGANSGAERVNFVKLSSGSAKSKDSNDEPAKQIANGRPLRHGTFTISQISVRKLRGNVELAELRVTSAPGQNLQLLGGALG